jgi:hypothetical protein
MKKYFYEADLRLMFRWAFQPPGNWRFATFFVWWVTFPEKSEDPNGIFTFTHKAYELGLLGREKTERLFLAGEIHSNIETSIILDEFNLPIRLSIDVQALIVGLNGYGIFRALDMAKAPDENVARDALCLDELLDKEIRPQIAGLNRDYPKPYFKRPATPGFEPRREL